MLPTQLYFISQCPCNWEVGLLFCVCEWTSVSANEPVFNQRKKEKRRKKKKNISYVIGDFSKNGLFIWTTWQLHWPIADSSAFPFSPRPEHMAWVTIGSLVGYRQRLIRADVSLHRCCHWEDTRAEEDGKKKQKTCPQTWDCPFTWLTPCGLHVVDDLQMAFNCIELVNEQGELL